MDLSIVSSLYYSAPYIEVFYRRTTATAKKIGKDYEIIFVNDGSPDHSRELAIEITKNDPHVQLIDLSRNFGHHKAIMTGLMHARGDLVFQIDVDLEEEPEMLEAFYQELIKTQADVVYGVQDKRKGGFFEKVFGGLFYRVFNFLSDVNMPPNLLMARLMTRGYVDALLLHKEYELDLGGLEQDRTVSAVGNRAMARIAMRDALVSAIFIAFSARSRRMPNMRMSASAAFRFRS